MAVSGFDSVMLGALFGDGEVRDLFSDTADIRAMLLVEGALARVQGRQGIIPAQAADAIWRASREVQIDPVELAAETERSGVVVPALVKSFRAAMQAPEHAQYVHFGATSQDIIDTGLVLRLRRVVDLFETRLTAVVRQLGAMAGEHAELPMAARTWGQVATPTSFGAIVASWGAPLLVHLQRLKELRPRLLVVSLSGAAGTSSQLMARAPGLRAALAQELKLGDPGRSWHSTRDTIAEFSAWATLVSGALGKLGKDLLLMAQTDVGEVILASGGGSSTMPQKNNPVQPSLLVAIAGHLAALNSSIQQAQVHAQQRDGAAWMREWLALPQICVGLARSLGVANDLIQGLQPNRARMKHAIEASGGLIHAEALSFALAGQMPRPEAQRSVKDLCIRSMNEQRILEDLAREKWPDTDLSHVFDLANQMGLAGDEARSFSEEVKTTLN